MMLFVFLLLPVAFSQDCSHQSCRDCLNVSGCKWCSDKNYDGSRCGTRGQLIAQNCPRNQILRRYDMVPRSPVCRGHDHECGVCKCGEEAYGKFCECDASRLSQEQATAACTKPNYSAVCSGRGECVCGQCSCSKISSYSTRRYAGRFCECDNYSCDYSHHNYMICGGPERGRCDCGLCRCNPGWTGNACECTVSMDSCRASNGLTCNGKGTCICGRCQCSRDSFYRGPTCEECPTCPGKCSLLKDCVRAKVFGTGPLTQDELFNKCPHDQITVVDVVDTNGDARLCLFMDYDDDCMFRFTYEYSDVGTTSVRVGRTKTCPQP